MISKYYNHKPQTTPTVIFPKVEKNISKIIFVFYLLTLNIICCIEFFFRLCLRIFESDTVKSD